MFRDIVHNLENSESINGQQHTATVTGTECDMLAFLDILAVVSINAVAAADATHYFTFSFTECATTGGSFTAVPSAQVIVIDSWDLIINATGEAGVMHPVQVQLSAGMRYLKAVATESGGSADAHFGVSFLWSKRHQPASS